MGNARLFYCNAHPVEWVVRYEIGSSLWPRCSDGHGLFRRRRKLTNALPNNGLAAMCILINRDSCDYPGVGSRSTGLVTRRGYHIPSYSYRCKTIYFVLDFLLGSVLALIS